MIRQGGGITALSRRLSKLVDSRKLKCMTRQKIAFELPVFALVRNDEDKQLHTYILLSGGQSSVEIMSLI